GTHQGQRSKPREQAGHMTASDKCTNLIKNVLLCRSHPHMPFAAATVIQPQQFSIALIRFLQ
ncbi:MAG: hypothetical protein ACJAUW_001370, partial [Yoonia sp.]